MHNKNLTQNPLKVATHQENIEFSDEFSTKQLDPTALTPTDEIAQKFVALFPYGYKSLYKPVGAESEWRTETRYVLTPRDLWREHQLPINHIGVRFGRLTRYLMLDIDIPSPYHPQNNEQGLSLIQEAMESIGLVRSILVRSSDSNGLHIYYPLPEAVNSFDLACGAVYALEQAGLKIEKGKLELFPNKKAYGTPDSPIEYQGHRLPLQPQSGSYLLDENLEPYSSSIEAFLILWEQAAKQQAIEQLKDAIAIAPRGKSYQSSQSDNGKRTLAEFERENAATIEAGFTGSSQTWILVFQWTLRHYVFNWITDPDELAAATASSIRNSIGYETYCSNKSKRDLDAWTKRMAKSVIAARKNGKPKYYPCKDRQAQQNSDGYQTTTEPRQTQPSAIERIKLALEQIGDRTFGTVRDLIAAIRAIAKCSPSTLYKETIKPLWQHLTRCNAAYSNDYSDLETEKSTIQPENQKIEIAETTTESAVTPNPINYVLRDEISPSSKINDPVISGTSAASIFPLVDSEPIQDKECKQPVSFELMVAIASTCPSARMPESKISRIPKEPPRQNPSTLENIQAIVTADPSKAGGKLAMLREKLDLKFLNLKREERSQTEVVIAWLEKFIECDRTRAIATDEHLQNCER